jgi:hypothetical protein
MSKIALRIEEIGSIEIDVNDPKFLASFLSWVAETYQPRHELEKKQEPENKQNISIESLEIDGSTQNKVESVLDTTDKFPSVGEVINYILSKKNYAHDTVELMDKFIGRRIKSNTEPKLFGSFNNIVRRSRTKMEKMYNIEWDKSERISYDSGTHPILYKIKKYAVQSDQIPGNIPNLVEVQSEVLNGKK